ncbi:MAG: thiamine-monophosphate kinase [Candidatus Omnitrophica bacterium]|nr:thiamine-monophosphate kinase [Candidatus Omnitrophota bacterium]
MNVRSTGEFESIDRIKKMLPELKNAVVGIGDDCAVLGSARGKYILVTSDMLIQDVHFELSKVSLLKVGRKALGVSLSDIAAMAGIPKYCITSVALPPEAPPAMLDDFYRGLLKLAKEFGVELVGGDTNRADKFICDVTVIGEVEKVKLIRRNGAKVGDKIFVTGSLGGSIKGKQFDFTPRVKEARLLADNFKIHSMIDISDGLSSDLHHIADASGVGAVIFGDRIPVSRNADSRIDALSAGEDYELLFTAPKAVKERDLTARLKMPVVMIGEITSKREGVKITDNKREKIDLERSGYRHF